MNFSNPYKKKEETWTNIYQVISQMDHLVYRPERMSVKDKLREKGHIPEVKEWIYETLKNNFYSVKFMTSHRRDL